MIVRVMGSAAGGGSPQWNCVCAVCEAVRRDSRLAPRLTSTIAVGDGFGGWFLCNAGPDLGVQLRDSALRPSGDETGSPLQAVLLTDAELDHTLGLFALRQAHRLRVYGSAAVADLLRESGLLPTLRSYTAVEWRDIAVGEEFSIDRTDGQPSLLRFRAVPVGAGRLPRYARSTSPTAEAVIGYLICDQSTGGRVAIAPSVAADDERVGNELGNATVALIDGTFFDDDELRRTGRRAASGHSLGHVPVRTGALGRRVAAHGAKVVYTHLNNTNPMILEDSREREWLAQHGFSVASDGTEFVL